MDKTPLNATRHAAFDPDITVVARIDDRGVMPGHSPFADEERVTARDRPSSPMVADSRANLTILTGPHAGRLVPIDSPLTIGRAADADLVVDDTGVSRHHARVARASENAFYVEDLRSTNGTYIRHHRIGLALLRAGDLLQLGPQLRVQFDDRADNTRYREPLESMVPDPLTRVFNWSYLKGRLLAEIAFARAANREVALLMIEIDGLEDLSVRLGQVAGDAALSTTAARIQSTLRKSDVLGRYGGDLFIVLALGSATQEAGRLAERIRSAVGEPQLDAQGRPWQMTASIGVAAMAELEPSEDPGSALLAAADARLLVAKAAGKNHVCSSEPIVHRAKMH
jgi:two-component system, cell cycle response regulator